MAVRAYILIGTAVGTAGTVYKGLHKLAVADAKVLSAETVTGPFDVIAVLESEERGRAHDYLPDYGLSVVWTERQSP